MNAREKVSAILSATASAQAVEPGTMILSVAPSVDDKDHKYESWAYRVLEAVKAVDLAAYKAYPNTPDACAIAHAMLENGEVNEYGEKS